MGKRARGDIRNICYGMARGARANGRGQRQDITGCLPAGAFILQAQKVVIQAEDAFDNVVLKLVIRGVERGVDGAAADAEIGALGLLEIIAEIL